VASPRFIVGESFFNGPHESMPLGRGRVDAKERGKSGQKSKRGMNKSFSKLVAGIVGLAGLGAVGCTTTHSPHPMAMEKAVMCDKCKTTWVTRVEPSGRSVYRYTREPAMVCPDCRSAVENWVRTGELKHSCAHCKGKMTCETPMKN
jgi:hypothetical protein